MEQLQATKNEVKSRAKEIDTGAIPLPMENVLLGLPVKPDPTTDMKISVKTRPWTFGELVSQYKLVASIDVDSTKKGIVWYYNNCWRDVVKYHFGTNFQQLFLLKSWTLCFKFEFRSNFQQVGQFLISYTNIPQLLWSYFNLDDESSFMRSDYLMHTQFPHRKIAMGEDVDVTFKCKWLSPFQAAYGTDGYAYDSKDGAVTTEDPGYDMGTLFLSIPFEMQTATNVDNHMTVRVWTYLEDLVYAAYDPTDGVFG